MICYGPAGLPACGRTRPIPSPGNAGALPQRIFWKDGVEEILNLQPKGNKAKPYQVKQVRHVILKYRLGEKVDA